MLGRTEDGIEVLHLQGEIHATTTVFYRLTILENIRNNYGKGKDLLYWVPRCSGGLLARLLQEEASVGSDWGCPVLDTASSSCLQLTCHRAWLSPAAMVEILR